MLKHNAHGYGCSGSALTGNIFLKLSQENFTFKKVAQ